MATVDDLGRRFDAGMAQVLAYGAEIGHAAALADAREAVTAYSARLTESLHLTANVPEAPAVEPPVVDVTHVVDLPPRKTTTTVERDHRGLISKTTATEADV